MLMVYQKILLVFASHGQHNNCMVIKKPRDIERAKWRQLVLRCCFLRGSSDCVTVAVVGVGRTRNGPYLWSPSGLACDS